MEKEEAKQGRETNIKDWTGGKSIYKTIGASNHCADERAENDFYATPPKAVRCLLEMEQFSDVILEPCCGQGHIAETLKEYGHKVIAKDLYDHGYGEIGEDFLQSTGPLDCDIITNPPYKMAREFVENALERVTDGHKVAMLLKLTFLEGKKRRPLFDTGQLAIVYVSRSRLACGKNGEFFGESAIAYAWFLWIKGYKGNPAIKWFN